MGSTTLLIFLLVQVFVMGVLVSLAVRYGLAHFKGTGHEPKTATDLTHEEFLTPLVREQLLKTSQEQFQEVIRHSATDLQHDLESSAAQINQLIKRLAGEVLENEMQRYHAELTRLRQAASSNFGTVQTELAKQQAELKAKMTREVEYEKQQLVKLIETKLADAVGAFLVETLQHNVDLGSQSTYLVAMLEEHKADLIKEIVDEYPVAR